uniref:Ig-like domain-containing protein n=1 Tax=Naja naja TaxID=35670 RepID=A0A8C6VJF4_NAJNA
MGPGVPPDGLPPLAAHFLAQWKFECLFLNGMQRVRFLYRYIYDRQEIVLFDSDLGKHVAVTALGEADADYWNRNEQILQYQKACVDRFCRLGYEVGNYEAAKREERAIGRRTKPTVTISPTKMDPASPNTILLCTATGFYPLEIEVQWLKNGQLEEEGVAFGEELQNGDWTYQLQVMLETQPQRGDVYTCQVGHVSLEAPITVQWGKPLPSCPEKGERPSLWEEPEWPLLGEGGPDPPAQVRLLLLPQSPVPPALPGANSGQGSWGP